MFRTTLQPLLPMAASVAAASAITPLVRTLGLSPGNWLNLLWTVASFWAVVECVQTVKWLPTGRSRRGWVACALGNVSWFFGQLLWDFREIFAGQLMPFAGLQDALYIAIAPAYFVAFYFFSGNDTSALEAARKISNLGIVCCTTAAALIMVASQQLLGRDHDPAFMFSLLGWGLTMPTAFLAGLLCLWLYVPVSQHRSIGTLVVSAGAHAVAMVAYAYRNANYSYSPNQLDNYLFVLALLLTVWAARSQRKSEPVISVVEATPTQIPGGNLEPALPAVCTLVMAAIAVWKRDTLGQSVVYMAPLLALQATLVAVREVWSARIERRLFRQLRQSEATLRQVVDSNMTGILFCDLDGTIFDANDAFLEVIGYTREDLTQGKLRWDELTPPEYQSLDAHAVQEMRDRRICAPYEKEYFRRDGSRVPILLGAARLAHDTERSVCFVVDLTDRKLAERELTEVQARLAAALDHLPFSFWSMDRAGTYVYQNLVCLKRWGDLTGCTVEAVDPRPEEIEKRKVSYDRAFAGEVVREEVSFGTGANQEWYNRIIVPIQQNSEITGIFGVNVDLTEQKRAQLRVQESEARYRLLAEHSGVGIWQFDTDGRTIFANAPMLALLGFESLEDLLPRHYLDFLTPASQSRWEQEGVRRDAGLSAVFELDLLPPNGDQAVPMLVSSVPLLGSDNAVTGVICTFTDLSDLKATQRALSDSERRFRALVENASDGIAAIDPDGTIRYAGPSNRQLLGYGPEELVGRNIREFFREKDGAEIGDTIARIGHSHVSEVAVRVRARRRDGNWITCEGVLSDLTRDPAIGALVLNYRDTTERLRAEQALRESEQRLQDFMENSPAAIFLKDLDGRYVHVNRHWVTLFKRRPADAIGRTDAELFEAEAAVFADSDRQTLAKDAAMQFEENFTDGAALRTCLVHKFPLRRADGRVVGVGGIATDITEQFAAEQALRFSEGRYRSLVEGARDAIFTLSLDGRMSSLNPAAEAITGVRNAERLNRSFLEVLPDSEAPRALNMFSRVLSGATVPVVEFPVRGAGDEWVVLEFTLTPQYDGERVIGVLGIGRDITERRKLEDQLRQSQKMESVGQLAGGVAHDFNNLLTIIQCNASMIELEDFIPETVSTSVQEISAAAERAAGLTRQLLAFSRRQIIQPRDLDLNELIGDLTKMLRRLLGEDITLQFESSSSIPVVHADAGMLEQVLLNLSVNARDAMPEGGRLSITTSPVSFTPEEASHNPEARPGTYVKVSVVDTGAGIPAKHLPHVFEPFFTTKDVGKGTGLGLATVYGIIKQHQGWIVLNSTPGTGTCFELFLPAVAPGMNEASENKGPAKEMPKGHETIMVVEDEPSLRSMVTAVLCRLGYKVIEAESGVAALQIWKERHDDVDLLFTDMVMPDGLSGHQLAATLRKERPSLRVLFTSGYSAQMLERNGRLPSGAECLQKPYMPPELASAVRTALSKPAVDVAA